MIWISNSAAAKCARNAVISSTSFIVKFFVKLSVTFNSCDIICISQYHRFADNNQTKQMARITRLLLTLFVLSSLRLVFSFADEREPKLSPRQTVFQWTQVYGVDMDSASDFTTLEFREGMTKKDWAARYSEIIKAIGYKHMGGEIIAELTEETKSMVVMKAKIMTVAGGVNQVEIYELLKLGGTWLINNITVKEESEFGKSRLDKEI